MLYIILIIELLIIIFFVIYNLKLSKKTSEVKNTIIQIQELTVTRDILNIASEKFSTKEKFKKINEYILENLKVDFSAIMLNENQGIDIIATNIKDLESLNRLKNIKILEDNLNSEQEEILKLELDKKILGYWYLKSEEKNLKKLDNKVILNIKETLVDIIRVMDYQSAFETLTKDDEFTSFKTKEYLFSDIKNIIDKFDKSVILMLKIDNLKNINEKYGRKSGNKIISLVSQKIKQNINKDSFAVRYSGPKLVLVFKNIPERINSKEEIEEYLKLNELKNEILKIEIKSKLIFKIKPKIKIAYSIYYKNNRLHKITNNLEEYLDNSENENLEKI